MHIQRDQMVNLHAVLLSVYTCVKLNEKNSNTSTCGPLCEGNHFNDMNSRQNMKLAKHLLSRLWLKKVITEKCGKNDKS